MKDVSYILQELEAYSKKWVASRKAIRLTFTLAIIEDILKS